LILYRELIKSESDLSFVGKMAILINITKKSYLCRQDGNINICKPKFPGKSRKQPAKPMKPVIKLYVYKCSDPNQISGTKTYDWIAPFSTLECRCYALCFRITLWILNLGKESLFFNGAYALRKIEKYGDSQAKMA